MKDVAKIETHPPAKCLPDSLRRLVEGETFWNGADVAERGWRPVPVPDGLRSLAQRHVSDLDHELKPAAREWISGRIATLLAHYWTPSMPEIVQTAVARDWLNILGHLPRHAIEHGCVSYLKTGEKFGPKPGQILELSEAHVADAVKMRDRLQACLSCKPGVVERKRGGTVTVEQALATAARIKAELLAD